MKKTVYSEVFTVLVLMLAAGCSHDETGNQGKRVPTYNIVPNKGSQPYTINAIPRSIPGTARAENHDMTDGYGPSNVQAQLKINVKDGTKEIKVIRDNTDPFVITKPYTLKHADPYAVRSYLEAAVGAKSITNSPAQVTAVKYTDGTGVILVSAEEYRFLDSEAGRGIDRIVASLDRPGLTFLPEADVHVYFPRISRASNLRDMLIKVGSSELDPEFEVAPGTIKVDGELNALIVKASKWNWAEMLAMLKQYDKPIPEVKVYYRVLEIYAENDDRIGIDFQSWKNNEGIDLFKAGTTVSRNWGTFFTSGVQNTGSNRTSYWNFNPKWNTRYLDFMTSIGKAKCLAQGCLLAQNRKTSQIQVNTGFFYDRTFYKAGAATLQEKCEEFAYTDPNPDTTQRESLASVMPFATLKDAYKEAGVSSDYLIPAGYVTRIIGTQTTGYIYSDATEKLTKGNVSSFSKYLTGYIKNDATGTVVPGTWYNTNWDTYGAAPGIIHGWLQYPMVQNGFKFSLNITPVVTGKAAKMDFNMSSISLLGWNADGSARSSSSETNTTVQIGYDAQEFVIGGLRKSESVRATTGLPFFKDLPVIGRIFSTESESIKQSQLVLIAKVEYSFPESTMNPAIRENIGKIVKGVNKGMDSKVGNMFFQQYKLDDDREARIKRLDSVGNIINDEYREIR